MGQIGNENELFFNRESKNGNWEITYDSTNDYVQLDHYTVHGNICQQLKLTKKEFIELKTFIINLRLKKNYKLKFNLNKIK